MAAIPVCLFQNALIRAEEERDKNDMEIIKQREKTALLEGQVQKAQSDRENLQSEMEILLDRINKLSELLDKARVGQSYNTVVAVDYPYNVFRVLKGFYILDKQKAVISICLSPKLQ